MNICRKLADIPRSNLDLRLLQFTICFNIGRLLFCMTYFSFDFHGTCACTKQADIYLDLVGYSGHRRTVSVNMR